MEANIRETDSLLSIKSVDPTPETVTKLVKRLKELTYKLLPVQVDPTTITEPTSRVVTQKVVSAYIAAAGDFVEILPYALLRTRSLFLHDADHSPADYDEDYCRSVACEVIARRVVGKTAPERLSFLMSARYRMRESDGDLSGYASVLELAIDTNCTVFLSSNEVQHVVNCLWRGDWIQKSYGTKHEIHYVPYDESRHPSFWSHLDPSRLSVPSYQNMVRIVVWIVFLAVYSQAVREPLEQINRGRRWLDGWEIALYIMALSFTLDELSHLFKILRYFTLNAFSFWTIISLATDALLITAFTFRLTGMYESDPQRAMMLHFRSFEVLSFVAPLIWMKLITVVDGFKYVGTMQICVARMLRESGIFFALLAILGIGFAQGLYAIDAADGQTDHGYLVVNSLIQSLLQSPDFSTPSNASALVMYYFWSVTTTVILLNILISLFSSAYSEIVDNAEAQYLAYFSAKCIGMIRAPDEFVYPAPFNLIELVILPWEWILRKNCYAALNRIVMSSIFFLPLVSISVWETQLSRGHKQRKENWVRRWLSGGNEDAEDEGARQDPIVDDEGLVISKVSFDELVRVFPNTRQSMEASIVSELQKLQAQIERLEKRLERANGG